jgi:hypothetical protein
MSRALFHDVRGVLGAAASNIDFLRARLVTVSVGEEASPVLDEIAHELRLVSDVIALAGSADDRVVELDLRAVLFFARGARPLAIDATHPPFIVRARRSELLAFASDAIAAASRDAAVVVSEGACVLRGIESVAVDRLRSAEMLRAASVVATIEGGALVLRHESLAAEQPLDSND